MKYIAMTGATSPLGISLIEALSEEYTVITIGRRNSDILFDLEIHSDFNLPHPTDAIIHLAAALNDKTDDDILRIVEVNVKGILKICMLARKYKIKHLIYISSIYATLTTESPYYSYYALTKKQAEDVAFLYCKRFDIKLSILRPTQIYGPNLSFSRNQPLFYTIIKQAKIGKTIFIYGKNDALKNYIYISDLTNIIVGVIQQGLDGSYDVIFPRNYRLSEIAHTAQKIFEKGGEVIFLSDKNDIPDNTFSFSDCIYQKLNFWPQVNLENGISLIKKGLNAKNGYGKDNKI